MKLADDIREIASNSDSASISSYRNEINLHDLADTLETLFNWAAASIKERTGATLGQAKVEVEELLPRQVDEMIRQRLMQEAKEKVDALMQQRALNRVRVEDQE